MEKGITPATLIETVTAATNRAAQLESGTFDKQSHNIMGSFADSETGSLIGGKIRSLTVHTTCELMLAEPLDCTFSREFDPRTGQNELHVRRKLLTDL
ncbi:unnamed protein product [Rotaria sordida]|uniref:Uncharacterized protein n=1 Tax=Rotaria sordida TaxID=392033 RepID=A0A814LJ14_9BILA|nr:unnamed protein product [Rotaria sordida]